MNFKKPFPILLTLLLFLTDAIQCSQHNFPLTFFTKKVNNEKLKENPTEKTNKKNKDQPLPKHNDNQKTDNYEEILNNAKNFYGSWYENIQKIVDRQKISGFDLDSTMQALQQADVIIPSVCFNLIINFLIYKQKNGTAVEKDFYLQFDTNKPLDCIKNFVIRLLTKRPLVFTESTDCCVLMNQDRSYENAHKDFFENLPNDRENIKHYITYDEMLISAFLGLWTLNAQPVNSGSRNNCGDFDSSTYEYYKHGVGFTGLVGPRLEKPYYMEYKHIIVDPEQNTAKNGYGENNEDSLNRIWAEFYHVNSFPLFQEVEERVKNEKPNDIFSNNTFLKIYNADLNSYIYFNVDIYKKRMGIMLRDYMIHFLAYILCSQEHKDKKILFYIPDLGCGPLAKIDKNNISYIQSYNKIQIDTIMQCLQIDFFIDWLKNYSKNHTCSDSVVGIELGYFGFGNSEQIKTNYNTFNKHSNLKDYNSNYFNLQEKPIMYYMMPRNTLLTISQRNPFDPLPDIYQDKQNIYVATAFPWDSNAPVGNEAAIGKYYGSACSIAYGPLLLNYCVNPYLPYNIENKFAFSFNVSV